MSQTITGAPRVTEMKVIPVAGQDSMLLNLSGAHAPYFTRNLVILTDSAGNTGVGEVPGGEKIRQTLEESRDLVIGAGLGSWNNVLSETGRRFADRDAGGRGFQTFDLRTTVHVQAALECALLDLLGQHLGVPFPIQLVPPALRLMIHVFLLLSSRPIGFVHPLVRLSGRVLHCGV